MENYIVAVDLGSSETRVVAGVCDEKKPFGFDYLFSESQSSKGVRRGAVYNREDASKVLTNLMMGVDKRLRAGQKKGAALSKMVGVNINGNQFQTYSVRETLRLQGQPVSKRTLQHIEQRAKDSQLQYSNDEDIIRLIPLGYSIDNEPDTDDVIGRSGASFEAKYLCFKARKKDLEAVGAAFQSAKDKPVCYLTTASAKAGVLLSPAMLRSGVVLVDLGAGVTGVAAFYRDALRYEISIPFGSDTITSDIKTAFGIATEDAEYLKRNAGIISEADVKKMYDIELPSGKTIPVDGTFYNFVVKARVEEIAAYISAAIVEAQRRGCRDMKVFLTGGGARLKGLDEVLAEKLGLCVYQAPSAVVGLPDVDLCKFAGALGMASQMARFKAAEEENRQPTLQMGEPSMAENGAEEPDAQPEMAEAAPENAPQPQPEPQVGEPGRGSEPHTRKASPTKGHSLLGKFKSALDKMFDEETNIKS